MSALPVASNAPLSSSSAASSVQSSVPPLEAVGLTVRYVARERGSSDVLALDSLDLAVRAGEVFCLLGANGAGKTTAINCFLGFVAPSGGTARVAGVDVATDPLETKRRLAYIPEQVMLYPNLSGAENLEYLAELATGRSFTRRELVALLVDSGVPEDAVNRRVGTYSKGMRQKVGVALAVAKGADALLLDEPTSGLDPKASNEFSDLLARLSRRGAAILMATHDLFRAKESGTRVGIMRHGKLLAIHATADLTHSDLERIYLEHMRD